MVKYNKWQATIQLEMSYGQHWSVTVAITASRWVDSQYTYTGSKTARHQTYDASGINMGHHMID